MDNRKDGSPIQKFLDQFGITPLGALCLLALGVLPFIPPFTKEYLRRWLIMGILLGSQSMAFDFTAGYIGIVNFGFCAFMGLGAYASGRTVHLHSPSRPLRLFDRCVNSSIARHLCCRDGMVCRACPHGNRH
jgi:hypothetical protein